MRLFIALTLTPEVHAELDAFERTLRTVSGDSVRWVNAANIHLTLKFLGEVAPARLDLLIKTVAQAGLDCEPFDFSVRGTGVFPGWNHPRIIWAGVEGPAGLGALQATVDAATREIGFPSEERPFSPHLTLGRVNEWISPVQADAIRQKMDGAKDRLFGGVTARQVTIFESTLKPGGAVYTPAAVCDLSKPNG